MPVAATRTVYASGAPTLTRVLPPHLQQVATGNRITQRNFRLGPAEVSGSITIPLSASEILPWLLIGIQGNVSPTTPTGATNGRLYSFAGGGTTLDSATVEYDDGARAHRAYGVYVDSMTIAGSANGEATVTFTLFGAERAVNALTGALSARVPTITEGYETLVMLDAFGGTPGVTQIPSFLQAWSITYGNGLQRKYLANNRNRTDSVVISAMTLTAQLTVEASNARAATELTAWDAATKRLVGLRFGFNSVNAISGDTAINEVQTLTMNGTPTGGTVVMQALGQQFSLAYNTSSGAAQTAINNALAALGSGYSVGVTGGPWPGTPLVVTFSGTEVAGRNVPMISTVTNSLTGGSTPNVTVVQTTPGYEAAEGITLTIPGFWSAADIGQTDAGTAMYQLSMDYIYDPTNALAFAMTALCGVANPWA